MHINYTYIADICVLLIFVLVNNVYATTGHADYHLLLKTLEDNFAETGDREAPPEEPVNS